MDIAKKNEPTTCGTSVGDSRAPWFKKKEALLTETSLKSKKTNDLSSII
jgi:hypothetical protein